MHSAAGVHEHAFSIIQANVSAGSSVLDVGTGSGALASRLMGAGYDVTATDLDAEDYRAAAPIILWDVSDQNIPTDLRLRPYDAVAAIEVLEHVENPLQALRNVRELLQPGGFVVVSTPHLSHPRSRIKFLIRGAPSYFGEAEYYLPGHRSLLPDWLLKRHLEEAGFTDVRLSYAGSLGLRGKQRWLYVALKPLLFALRALPTPRVDDGCVTFAAARLSVE